MTSTGQWKVAVVLFEGDAEVTADAVLHPDAGRVALFRTVPGVGSVHLVRHRTTSS